MALRRLGAEVVVGSLLDLHDAQRVLTGGRRVYLSMTVDSTYLDGHPVAQRGPGTGRALFLGSGNEDARINELLASILGARGGAARWNGYETSRPRYAWIRVRMFTPDRITFEMPDGTLVAERRAPGDSFAGLQMSTAWDSLLDPAPCWSQLGISFPLLNAFVVSSIEPLRGSAILGLATRTMAGLLAIIMLVAIVTVQLEAMGTVGDFLYLPEVLLLMIFVWLVFSGLAGPVWTTSSRARCARR